MRIKICRYENSYPKFILPCYFSSLTLNIIFNHILKYLQAENTTNYYLKYSSMKISALNIILCIIISLYFQPLTLYVYLNPTLKHRHVKISTPMQLICACVFILPLYIYSILLYTLYILFICLFIPYQSLTLSISHIHIREQRNKTRPIETFNFIYFTSFSILSLSIHITNVPYITHILFSTDISTNRVLKYLHVKISKQILFNRIFEFYVFCHHPSPIYISPLTFTINFPYSIYFYMNFLPTIHSHIYTWRQRDKSHPIKTPSASSPCSTPTRRKPPRQSVNK